MIDVNFKGEFMKKALKCLGLSTVQQNHASFTIKTRPEDPCINVMTELAKYKCTLQNQEHRDAVRRYEEWCHQKWDLAFGGVTLEMLETLTAGDNPHLSSLFNSIPKNKEKVLYHSFKFVHYDQLCGDVQGCKFCSRCGADGELACFKCTMGTSLTINYPWRK